MIVVTKSIKQGKSSQTIVLPKHFTSLYHIKDGDTLKLDIRLLDKINENTISFRCAACQHIFDMEKDDVYCPICGSESVMEYSQEDEDD